ncbi:universal stress protein [Streptomyces sp. NBC_01304]|uniref:universal stress protein n=1 Tax=Streptomyces sp. NBC_01304 TaxID=2903818 RepID=UPI002E1151C8|nr:universal stress protein [Streptomyces sp. NBC_01304]
MSTPQVVAAVDGSPDSARALEWAVAEARLRGTGLRIVHVWPYAAAERPGLSGPGDVPRPPSAVGDPVLDRIRSAFAGRPDLPPVQYLTVEGTPEQTLPQLGVGAQLLVLGSRGRGGFASLLLGSNGLVCARESACPVVVVPRPGRPRQEPLALAVPRPSVVLGLPAPSYDTSTVSFAFEEAARRGARLEVICAYPWTRPQFVPYGEFAPTATDEREVSAEYARLARAQLADHQRRHPGVRVDLCIAPGDAAGHLVAASRAADLIVVGRHRRRMPAGRLLGSVTNAVLLHAGCPVAVVPTEPEIVPAEVGAAA